MALTILTTGLSSLFTREALNGLFRHLDIINMGLLRYCIVCNGLTRYDVSRLSWWWQQC